MVEPGGVRPHGIIGRDEIEKKMQRQSEYIGFVGATMVSLISGCCVVQYDSPNVYVIATTTTTTTTTTATTATTRATILSPPFSRAIDPAHRSQFCPPLDSQKGLDSNNFNQQQINQQSSRFLNTARMPLCVHLFPFKYALCFLSQHLLPYL